MTPEPFHCELRQFASELARQGGAIARLWAGKVSVRRKADRSPVTEADHAVQAELIRRIGARYPDHGVIAEETLTDEAHRPAPGAAPYCWVIDPIDGTRNYARGLTIYAISVAVLQAGAPVAGAIFDASAGALYSAALNGGATCDDLVLQLHDSESDRDPTILVSSFHQTPVPSVIGKWLNAYHFRNHGSLALHLAWLAAGYADAAYGVDGHLWDIAAGGLLVAEAGGVVTTNDGAPRWPIDLAGYGHAATPILAGTQVVHGKLLQSLSSDAPQD